MRPYPEVTSWTREQWAEFNEREVRLLAAGPENASVEDLKFMSWWLQGYVADAQRVESKAAAARRAAEHPCLTWTQAFIGRTSGGLRLPADTPIDTSRER